MEHWVHSIVRMFPYWAIPVMIFSLEMCRYFHRRLSPFKWFFGFVSVVLALLVGVWFAFRGDLHSDEWVRGWLG